MDGLLVIFMALALAWAVQMLLAHRQTRRFMTSVRALQDRGRVAIGVSSQKRLQRKTYVGLAADADDVVRAACQLSGQTVWARPKAVDDFDGMTLAELRAAPERSSQRRRAAAMAARALRGELDADAGGSHQGEEAEPEQPLQADTERH